MALERQITFKTGVAETIDTIVEEYLRNNEVDPAAIQVVIDAGTGTKTATLTYGSRDAIRKAYENQGRTYSDADAVTYCHVKDIILPFGKDLDEEVNNFLSDDNVSALSISRYFTLANQGAFILYINLEEQKAKLKEKEEEVKKVQEEMAQKLAQSAVKDTDLNTNDAIEKYAEMSEQSEVRTAGLSQVEGEVSEASFKTTTASENQESKVVDMKSADAEAKAKNKKFWRK